MDMSDLAAMINLVNIFPVLRVAVFQPENGRCGVWWVMFDAVNLGDHSIGAENFLLGMAISRSPLK